MDLGESKFRARLFAQGPSYLPAVSLDGVANSLPGFRVFLLNLIKEAILCLEIELGNRFGLQSDLGGE